MRAGHSLGQVGEEDRDQKCGIEFCKSHESRANHERAGDRIENVPDPDGHWVPAPVLGEGCFDFAGTQLPDAGCGHLRPGGAVEHAGLLLDAVHRAMFGEVLHRSLHLR